MYLTGLEMTLFSKSFNSNTLTLSVLANGQKKKKVQSIAIMAGTYYECALCQTEGSWLVGIISSP